MVNTGSNNRGDPRMVRAYGAGLQNPQRGLLRGGNSEFRLGG